MTLYRKYRPLNFDQLVGQNHICEVLKTQIIKNALTQSYIFTGPRGCGKTTTARIFSKAVNCLNFTFDTGACNNCESCRISDSQNLDVIELDAASNRNIDDIRDLRESVQFNPIKLNKKIYIIDEVHMLTKESFNALLKTLEEPPSHVMFILATTDIHKVPITIQSRCQRFDFRLGTTSEIVSMLKAVVKNEGFSAENDVLNLVSELGQGSYRDSLSVLEKIIQHPEALGNYNVAQNILGVMTDTNVQAILGVIRQSELGNFANILKDKNFTQTEILQLLDSLSKQILSNNTQIELSR